MLCEAVVHRAVVTLGAAHRFIRPATHVQRGIRVLKRAILFGRAVSGPADGEERQNDARRQCRRPPEAGCNQPGILGVTEDPRFYGLTPMCAPIHVSV